MLIKEQIDKIKKKQTILEDFLARNKIDADILGESHLKVKQVKAGKFHRVKIWSQNII
jgi:cytochrome c oxidase assembly protein Cox11